MFRYSFMLFILFSFENPKWNLREKGKPKFWKNICWYGYIFGNSDILTPSLRKSVVYSKHIILYIKHLSANLKLVKIIAIRQFIYYYILSMRTLNALKA